VLLGDDAWILDKGLPPLAWNTRLYQAASDHNQDMIANNYFDTISPDGEGPAERVASAGYLASSVGELLAMVVSEPGMDPADMARSLFEAMLTNEFVYISGVKTIFNPEMTDVGISVETTVSGEGNGDYAHVAVADFAAPVELRTFPGGDVYDDREGNPAPGERASGLLKNMRMIEY